MAQEDKKLLLQDLSARLSHGVIVSTPKGNGHLCSINQTIFGNEYGVNIEAIKRDYFNDEECVIKPYLRPMNSMTEDEKGEYHKLCDNYYDIYFNSVESIDWLNAHHFDHRGLIEKGLAKVLLLKHPKECIIKIYENIFYKYFPIEFSSYEDYVKYLKEKGFVLEAPEGNV